MRPETPIARRGVFGGAAGRAAAVRPGAASTALGILLLAAACQPGGAGSGSGETGPVPAGLAGAAAGPASTRSRERVAAGFERAAGSRAWRFPRDHGAHPAYETEWWYLTGIVRDASGRRFGYQVTFFRVGLPAGRPEAAQAAAALSPWRARDLILAHAAVTDVQGRRLSFADRADRAVLGFAFADTAGLDVAVGAWRLRGRDGEMTVRIPADETARIGLDLTLRAERPPVLHGDGGLTAKGSGPDAGASWYVSVPRLRTEGALHAGGRRHAVSGTSWMDHEFFTGGLAPGQEGWDWLSLRLEDGRDVMLYRLRGAGGATDFALGTATARDGTAARPLDAAGAVFQPRECWRSPATGVEYPVAWRIELPREDLALEVRTPVEAQEIPSRESVGFSYWEGLVDAAGRWEGRSVRGEGYLEMTGYDRPLRLP
jgi:predicted secreted hydrolase